MDREALTFTIEDTIIAREDSLLAGIIEKEISLKPLDRELFLKLYVEEQSLR